MCRLEIPFKRFTPDGHSVPTITVRLTNGKETTSVQYVIDSGADYCTFPIATGKMLGIDFKKVASKEVRGQWSVVSKMSSERFNELIEDAIENKYVIPTSFKCACGKDTDAFYYPITVEIEKKFKEEVLAVWNTKNTPALLGRFGVFNKIKKITFEKGETLVLEFK